MKIRIQSFSSKHSVVAYAQCSPRICKFCKSPMSLVLQEPEKETDELSGYWFCDECKKVDILTLPGGLFT